MGHKQGPWYTATPRGRRDPRETRVTDQVVLIVEDEPEVAEFLQLVVENHFGVRTVVARDGLEALTQAQKLKPSVILLDLLLPQIDGLEVSRRLKASPTTRKIPIIAVSAAPWGWEETRKRALGAGCNAYVHKLYEVYRLVLKLGEFLGFPDLSARPADREMTPDKPAAGPREAPSSVGTTGGGPDADAS